MDTVFSDDHALRDAKTEFCGGELIAPFECPARAAFVLERVRQVQLGAVLAPQDFGRAPLEAVHDRDFVAFLAGAWDEWLAAGYSAEAYTTALAVRRTTARCPEFIEGKIGYYASSVETSITAGTWPAAYASAQVALTAAGLLGDGRSSAFALCRPPGHHAARDMFGGFCFLNNAAIAAQSLRERGAARVAVLDVDFHHGNGTQDIFYQRDDVLVVSLHGDPLQTFPYFLGHADECGAGPGEGFNLNLPMAPGTGFAAWREALARGLERVTAFAPDALVVSLGVDTFKGDPISFFALESDDFSRYGEDIAALGLPTLFVMEGGYAVEEIGVNAVNVLTGFESAHVCG